jgi:hypothetical protein
MFKENNYVKFIDHKIITDFNPTNYIQGEEALNQKSHLPI